MTQVIYDGGSFKDIEYESSWDGGTFRGDLPDPNTKIIYATFTDKGCIDEWSTTPIFGDKGTRIELDKEHPMFRDACCKYVMKEDGTVVKDPEIALYHYKEEKDKELNQSCSEHIKAGFYHTVNGEEYYFSFDNEAQLNFQGAEKLFSDDIVTSMNWTVKKDDRYLRIEITKPVMEELSLKILEHKDGNISKYRDVLSPLVWNATSKEEIDSIHWDMELPEELEGKIGTMSIK